MRYQLFSDMGLAVPERHERMSRAALHDFSWRGIYGTQCLRFTFPESIGHALIVDVEGSFGAPALRL